VPMLPSAGHGSCRAVVVRCQHKPPAVLQPDPDGLGQAGLAGRGAGSPGYQGCHDGCDDAVGYGVTTRPASPDSKPASEYSRDEIGP